MLFDKIYCSHSRTAGCKHGICYHDQSLINGIRQFAVIFMRFVCLRISVQSNMSDLCRRYQSCDSINHSKAGAKHRHNCKLFTCDHRCHTCFQRSFHFHILQRKISQRLKSHKNRNFLDQLTKLICSSAFVTEQRNFVLNQRMLHNIYVFHVEPPLNFILKTSEFFGFHSLNTAFRMILNYIISYFL